MMSSMPRHDEYDTKAGFAIYTHQKYYSLRHSDSRRSDFISPMLTTVIRLTTKTRWQEVPTTNWVGRKTCTRSATHIVRNNRPLGEREGENSNGSTALDIIHLAARTYRIKTMQACQPSSGSQSNGK